MSSKMVFLPTWDIYRLDLFKKEQDLLKSNQRNDTLADLVRPKRPSHNEDHSRLSVSVESQNSIEDYAGTHSPLFLSFILPLVPGALNRVEP